MGEFDPTGYIYEGEIYCHDCIGDDLREETGALFEGSAMDSPVHCGGCHEFLPSALTKEGYSELEKRIRNFDFEYWGEELLWEYMQCWGSHDWRVIPTFAGMMDPFGDF